MSAVDGVVAPLATSTTLDSDPVLHALHAAEHHYQRTLEALAQKDAELEHIRAEHALTRAQFAELQQLTEHERERGDALSEALQHIHRALFGGDTYELILKACLSLTQSRRGAYLMVSPRPGEPPQACAVFELDVAEGSPLREFVTDLARDVLDTEQVSVLNDLSNSLLQPPQVRALNNCIAAPVVLRSAQHGVVIVADKVAGGFDERDAAALISVGGHAAVAIDNVRLQREVREVYLSLIGVLAETMAARNPHVRDEMDATSQTATRLAQRLGLDDYQQSLVFYATQLRDVGNIGISDGVLNKPGELLEAERELIHAHAQVGHDLLAQVPLLEDVARIVRHHHERVDGRGYPDGLAGDGIPIEARIVAVVDAYTAIRSPRSYRAVRSPEEACGELRRGAGSQFDAQVVDAFLAELEGSVARDGDHVERISPHLPKLVVRQHEQASVAAE
ncbi:MAG: HD domain-containing protein [Chloroflexi bacterium]|nr:HD domain-containing protein [Chloroflexota bacterium]